MKGFTLIELVLYILTTAILTLTFSYTIFNSWDKYNLTSQTESLVNYLEYGFVYAQNNFSVVTIYLSSKKITAYSNNYKIFDYKLNNKVYLTSNRDDILFYPTLSATPISIYLSKNNIFCKIIISIKGRIRYECN